MSSRKRFFPKCYGKTILVHTGSKLNNGIYYILLRAINMLIDTVDFLERSQGAAGHRPADQQLEGPEVQRRRPGDEGENRG